MAWFKAKKDEEYKIKYTTVPLVFKISAFIIVLSFIAMLFWYTENLRRSILDSNRSILKAYAKLMSLATSESITGPARGIIFEEVIKKADFPLIWTNSDREPIKWRNIGIAQDDTTQASRQIIKSMLNDMQTVVKPVEITVGRSNQILGYIYLGEPSITRWVRIIPVLEMLFILVFVIIGMSVYNRVRGYEKQNIWLGLAREMAHQLGTPISSLLGWKEILDDKINDLDKEEYEGYKEIIDEIDKDIDLLSKIVVKFGRIGSMPELKPLDITKIVDNAVIYLQDRIPKLKKTIKLSSNIEPVPKVMANDLLITWACENLIKNAIEAMGKDGGEIRVSVRQNLERDAVQVIVTDTGKGISLIDQSKIFSPGFTTKKRGWGLGLSLARRIANEYHHGKLYLLESKPHQKTTFILELPVINIELNT